MKLLVTGGTGFLGRRAAAHFAALGIQVLVPGRAQLDITEEASVRLWFAANRPDAVLHCAAVSDTGACRREPERTARVNVEGAARVAAACAETGARLVFCSSDQVYAGSPLPGPHAETEHLAPGNPYAQQKLEAERLCAARCPDTVSLRLSWMYAVQSLPGEHGHFLSTLLAALRDPSLPLRWPVHDRRGITDVSAVVDKLPAALLLPAGVYNFGAANDADMYTTVREVLQAAAVRAQLQNGAPADPLARLAPDYRSFADAPRDIRMDPTRTAAAGILFETTKQGLCAALENAL